MLMRINKLVRNLNSAHICDLGSVCKAHYLLYRFHVKFEVMRSHIHVIKHTTVAWCLVFVATSTRNVDVRLEAFTIFSKVLLAACVWMLWQKIYKKHFATNIQMVWPAARVSSKGALIPTRFVFYSLTW